MDWEPLQEVSISRTIREAKGDERVLHIAFLATMAILLAIVESAIPKPLPWMRIGLANAITLYAFSLLKPKEVFILILARVIASSLFLGTFLSTTFLLSLTGAVSSFLVMYPLWRVLKRCFSLVGISIVGAMASNATQFTIVNLLFIKSRLSFHLLPFLFLFALVGGTLSGLFGRFLENNL
ncbi:MAG: Gx transporter family protein [Spirochaetota bacterium]